MKRHRQAIDESRRLAGLAAKERAESIRQQIAAAETLITVANTEVAGVDQTNTLLERLRNLAEKVRFHLNEPSHVPSGEGEELYVSLEQMESRIMALAKRARPNACSSPD